MGLNMVLSEANSTEDRSNTNLATVTNIFRQVAQNMSFPVSRNLLESVTHIISDIQDWGMDNSTVMTLQNQSSE